MHKEVKTVYLQSTYNNITVTQETFEQIAHFLELNRVCSNCAIGYDIRNPMVAKNYCLECLLEKEKEHRLTFLGQIDDHIDRYGSKQYQFISELGYIYVSSTTSDSRIDPSIMQTLTHWGFPIPETYTKNGVEKKLDAYHWSIYGNFKENTVIVLEYQERYGDNLHAVFLSNKKDQTVTELNKRKGYLRSLFKRATAEAEKTKDVQGYYHVNGNTIYQLWDCSLYPCISDLASQDLLQEKEA